MNNLLMLKLYRNNIFPVLYTDFDEINKLLAIFLMFYLRFI